MSMEEIPEDLIADCAQLVKANSIVGMSTHHDFYQLAPSLYSLHRL